MTPLEAQTKAATLGNLLQEQQLRKAQIQEAQVRAQQWQIQAQEAERNQQDIQTWNDAFYKNKGDYDQTFKDTQGQISPKMYGALADQYQQIRDRTATANLSDLKQQTAHLERQGGRLQAVLDDPNRADNWAQYRQDAINSGDTKPEDVPLSYPGDDWVKVHRYYGMGAENIARAEVSNREAAHAAVMNLLQERAEQAKTTGEELGLTGRIAGPMMPPATALGAAAAPVSNAAAIAGQGAPAGTNVSGSRFNTPTTQPPAATAIAPPQATLGQYDTKLTPQEETAFQAWKAKYAPNDSGADYDLRGAFKAGLTPDPQTGHWPDTFKKPNHPTFSDQSQYAQYAPDKAGHWEGDTFVPPTQAGTAYTSARSPQQEAWDNFRASVPKGALPFLPQEWSPAAQRTAQQLGLTAEQQAINARQRQEGGPKTAAEFAAAMTDPTKTPEERQRWKDALTEYEQSNRRQTANAAAVQNRSDTREFDKWSAKHEDLQKKEQDLWILKGQYGDMLDAGPDAVKGTNTEAVDPKRPDKVVNMTNPSTYSFYRNQYNQADKDARALQKQAKDIRQRFGWGEFSPQQGGGGATPAPAVSARSWKVGGQTYSEGQIITSKGRQFKVLGVENGKINAQPIQAP